MKPLISVIIPAYNKGDIIKETIDSALAQTYSNIEVILVDDGSTDNTAVVVKSIKDERLRYYYQPNSGLPAKPRNKGVELSTGEYVAFLDHDDLWMKDKLEKQMSIIEKDPKIALVSTNAYYILNENKTNTSFIQGLRSGYFNDKDFLPEIYVILSTTLVRKSAFLNMGGFNESSDLKAIEDYDLWLRIYPKHACYYLSECLIYYRKYSTSTSGSELHHMERALSHYKKYFVSYGFCETINNKRLAGILHNLSCLQYLSGDREYLGNSKKAFQLSGNVFDFLLYMFFLFPRKFTIKLYRLKGLRRGIVGRFRKISIN